MFSTLHFLCARLRNRGLNVDGILADSGISAEEIKDPWPLLSHDQCSALALTIIGSCKDPAIGLGLSDAFNLTELGVLGFALMTCQTFREARRLGLRYRVLKDPAIFIEHRFLNNRWEMVLHETYPFAEDVQRFFLEGHIVRTHFFCQSLCGMQDAIQGIELTYRKPEYASLYTSILPCPVTFGASENIIHFNHAALRSTLPLAEKQTHRLCVSECDTRFHQLDKVETIATKVYKEILGAHSVEHTMLLGLDDVAERFYMSPRTLRRKLQSEDTSFQKITGLVRRDLAVHYLGNTNLSTKEIAYSLGYSSVNNFRRAFKEWTQKKVSDFRAGLDKSSPEFDE